MSSEFDLIARHFTTGWPEREDVLLGVGDDAAILDPHWQASPGGCPEVNANLAEPVALRTRVAARHGDFDPANKAAAAAVGVSALTEAVAELCILGSEPRWMTLALTLPESSEQWLSAFASGLRELSRRWHIALAGGDTTRGPLSASIFVQGRATRCAERATLGSRACLVHSTNLFPPVVAALARAGWPVTVWRNTDSAAQLMTLAGCALPASRDVLDIPPSAGAVMAIVDHATADWLRETHAQHFVCHGEFDPRSPAQ